MPHFQIVTHKHLGAEKWTNVYFASAADLPAANVVSQSIMNAEHAVLKNTVTADYALVSEREQPYRNYIRVPYATVGAVAPTSGAKPYPLWCVVRCEFQPANSGKPDVKNLRVPVYSDEVADILNYTTTFQSFILNNYVTPLVALDGLEDDAGIPWTSGLVRLEIFDRDLTRHKHKKVVTL